MLRLKGMLGLGDNFYQRAVVRELGPVELETSWPQLYADLPSVRCVRPETRLRTQAKNASSQVFAQRTGAATQRIGYGTDQTILESYLRSAGVYKRKITFDGPPTGAKRTRNIVIRPATVRKEWRADSRNPDPRYIAEAADLLKHDFNLISVADLKLHEEWVVGDLPFAHERYHAGELSLDDLLALVDGAAGVVGGVGWVVPASVAYRVPLLLLYGGWGRMNGPGRLFDPRMDITQVVQAMPDRLCMCNDRMHNCVKSISHLEDYVERFYRLAEARSADVAA